MSATERDATIIFTYLDGSLSVNEERILNKLDAIDDRGVQTLVAVTSLQEQIKDVPALRERVTALEKWRWMAMGALGAASTSLGAQAFTAFKSGG